MARFKPYDYAQTQLIPVSFERQILPGSFEYALVTLIDQELDLSIFDCQYRNEDNGCRAYDPAIFLKIVLLAYSRGITSSRRMAQLCQENVLFMAVSAHTSPHFTTLADFISRSHEQIADLFVQVLLVCDAMGLIGRNMFAIDGCKIPGNASKKWSGTHADLRRKKNRLNRAARKILQTHRDSDQAHQELSDRDLKAYSDLRNQSRKIKEFLKNTQDKPGRRIKTIQSNITDNESAKMKGNRGVIQGYIGVAAVDDKHQVIIAADAFGQSTEHGLLEPMIEQAHQNLKSDRKTIQRFKLTADSGFHSAATIQYLHDQEIDAYVADPEFRRRDQRFKKAKKHYRPHLSKPKSDKFKREDFKVNLDKQYCICPAGKKMVRNMENKYTENMLLINFRAKPSDCDPCIYRKRCLQTPNQRTPRNFAVVKAKFGKSEAPLIKAMKAKIDSEAGRSIYSHRLGTVEPVFGNITSALGLNHFSLRGKAKVTGQWRLMALLHNIFKIQRYGMT